MKKSATIIVLCLLPILVLAQAQQGYYRFPAIYNETIVFTSEGDLWKVGVQGGEAVRLTTHHGEEHSAAVSPDGKWIAFSAQYEGPTEVYRMPIQGGLPTHLSHDGESARVVGWTPDHQIIYATRHFSTLPNTQLVILDPSTGGQQLVPLNQASEGDYTIDGNTIYFTRLPFQGSRTKRYKGGTAQNLWKFTTNTSEAVPLTTDYPGTSKEPMWWQNRIYFASDRDGSMNLWSMNEDGADLQQHTVHRGWDIQSPDLHQGKIVYQLGADLHLYDIATSTNAVIPITLTSDFDQTRQKWIKKPMDYLTDLHISTKGEKIALTSRGRVFVAPVKEGRLVEATRKEGIRYRNALFIPDSESILVLSDESGEQEFWTIPQNGVGKGKQLTKDAKVLRNEGTPSPDGKWMVFTDRDQKLWLYDMKAKKLKLVADSDNGNFYNLSWSPDSQWLAYVVGADNWSSQIKLYSFKDGSITDLTSDRVDSYSPSWSPDGKWLYFLSDRHFQSLVRSPWGPRQPEPFFDKTTKIYMIALNKDQRSPFKASDELQDSESAKKDKKTDKKDDTKKKDSKESVVVNIDLDGIQKRVLEVPVSPGDYGSLMANDKRLFWTEAETSLMRNRNLMTLDINNKDPKPKKLVENIRSYDLSGDKKKTLVRKGSNIYVFDSGSSAPAKLDKNKVDLSKWTFSIDPREEWRQMFVDAWRLERDYFYDRNLHGVDYDGLLARHLPLVDRVANRAELSDLIAQLVGELSALHIYVSGGDHRRGDDQIRPASLGARLIRDEGAGGYRIDHIYKSEPDYINRLSPLAKADVNVNEGDIILDINGVPTLSVTHPGELLNNKAGQQVLLRIKSRSSGSESNVVLKPISPGAESNLRYDEWEYSRRMAVEESGNGDIGYVHLRAMGGNNYSEWVRNFYPVFNRKGLIIDVRHNRGGNIDSWILEKLLRKAWFYWSDRVDQPTWNMQYAFRGHMVVLCNERTASDGEAFAEGFRRLGLGEIIGTRTWGGEIWLSFNNRLVDRGIASAAQSGVYGPEGEWLIEGHGVDPDIVVDNLPHATFKGEDAQLNAAIEYLKDKIRKDPVPVPPVPPYPDKSFDYRKVTNGNGK